MKFEKFLTEIEKEDYEQLTTADGEFTVPECDGIRGIIDPPEFVKTFIIPECVKTCDALFYACRDLETLIFMGKPSLFVNYGGVYTAKTALKTIVVPDELNYSEYTVCDWEHFGKFVQEINHAKANSKEFDGGHNSNRSY